MKRASWMVAVVSFTLMTAGCSGTMNVGTSGDGGGACSPACDSSKFCAGGSCYPKVAAGSCATTSDHAANDVCSSGLCLAGACCTSACVDSDPDCKATSCDPVSGACVYPGSTATCGPAESCASGSHTPASSCNGSGACTLAQPAPCATHACFDAHRCVATCTENSGCLATEYCSTGQCAPKLAAGAVCGGTSTSAAGSDCTSGSCLGTRCCTVACATTDAQCGATDCDSTGACVYPAQTITCGALQICTGSSYTPQSACDGKGACAPGVPQSCEPYVCNEPGAICQTSCTLGGAECAADGYCDAQKCALKGGPGKACATTSTSNADQACRSSICSVNCCVVDCPADPTTYNCKGICDTAGACIALTCANNFGCSGGAVCNTQCATDADCYAGPVSGISQPAFCDPIGATACCRKYAKGDIIYVDGVGGNDATPCCGGQAFPCQTLTHAMSLIAHSGTSGVVLQALNGDNSTSWTANETYPVHLGWGVTLKAPSIHFSNQATLSDIFRVYSYDAVNDTGTVTIEGGSNGIMSDGIYIGFDPDLASGEAAYRHTTTAVNAGVPGKTAVPLVLSEAWLNANDRSGKSTALNVGAGASVTLGPNPVEIGRGVLIGGPVDYSLTGYNGIYCKGAGATVQDDVTATATVLTMDGILNSYLDVEDGCTATITQGPTFGTYEITPSGWDGTVPGCPAGAYCQIGCSTSAGNGGVVVAGNGNVTFGSVKIPGAIRCALYGFDEETSNGSGSPTVVVNRATIDLLSIIYFDNSSIPPYGGTYYFDSACAGAMVTEGSFSATASTFTHSYMGVFVGSNAVSADLSGGGNGGNTFTCNNSTWGLYWQCGNNSSIVPETGGGDVVNATAAVGINAQNATWDNWDTTDNSTQIWSCSDTSYTNCTCAGPNCSSYTSPGIPPDGTDAIYLSPNTAATPLDTTAGAQSTSTTSCTFP